LFLLVWTRPRLTILEQPAAPGELNFELTGFNMLGDDQQQSMDSLFDPASYAAAFGGPPPSLDLAVNVPFEAAATSYGGSTMAALSGMNFAGLDDQPPILPDGAAGMNDAGAWDFSLFGFPPPQQQPAADNGFQQNATENLFSQNLSADAQDGLNGDFDWAQFTVQAAQLNVAAAAPSLAPAPAPDAALDFSEYLNYPPAQAEVEPATRNRMSSVATITPGSYRSISGESQGPDIAAWRARIATEAGAPSNPPSRVPSAASHRSGSHYSGSHYSGSDGALNASHVANGAVPPTQACATTEQPVSLEQFLKGETHHAAGQPAVYRPPPGAVGAGKRRVGGAYKGNVLPRYPS
jgi:hypothetical protein